MQLKNRAEVEKLLKKIDKKDKMIASAKELTFDSIGITLKSYPKTTERARKVLTDRLEDERAKLVKELEAL